MRKLTNIEQAILNHIWGNIQRIHSNIHQEYFDEVYCNDFISLGDIKVSGYDWSDMLDEPDREPNIVINGKNFWFYKHYGRGMETDTEEKLDELWLEDTLKMLRKLEISL
jgi:hypothetical protein